MNLVLWDAQTGDMMTEKGTRTPPSEDARQIADIFKDVCYPAEVFQELCKEHRKHYYNVSADSEVLFNIDCETQECYNTCPYWQNK